MLKGSLHISKGIYYVVFYAKDKSGELKQNWISAIKGNKRQAEERKKEILEEWEHLITAGEVKLLLWEYIEDWLERHRSRIAATTYDGYIHMLQKHIEPYFKIKRLKIRDVKPIHIEEYYAVKIKEGLSPNTVIKHGTLIRTALQDALKNRIIKYTPADLAEKPIRKKFNPNFCTAEELKLLWEKMQGTSIELPVYFAIFFGLRCSEAIGVKWSAIDFENKTLMIDCKVTRENVNGKVISVESDTMKTESSKRKFQLNDIHCKYLQEVKKKQQE